MDKEYSAFNVLASGMKGLKKRCQTAKRQSKCLVNKLIDPWKIRKEIISRNVKCKETIVKYSCSGAKMTVDGSNEDLLYCHYKNIL